MYDIHLLSHRKKLEKIAEIIFPVFCIQHIGLYILHTRRRMLYMVDYSLILDDGYYCHNFRNLYRPDFGREHYDRTARCF